MPNLRQSAPRSLHIGRRLQLESKEAFALVGSPGRASSFSIARTPLLSTGIPAVRTFSLACCCVLSRRACACSNSMNRPKPARARAGRRSHDAAQARRDRQGHQRKLMFNAMATVPVPSDWPEQQVKIVAEDVSPQVKTRDLPRHLRRRRTEADGRRDSATGRRPGSACAGHIRNHAPPDAAAGRHVDLYRFPSGSTATMRLNLGPSPYIESRHPKIVAAAKEAVAETRPVWNRSKRFTTDSLPRGTSKKAS